MKISKIFFAAFGAAASAGLQAVEILPPSGPDVVRETAATQPFFDPVASADGRFWRDVGGVRWRAVEVPAGSTSFELPIKRYLPEFEEAEILVDVRIGKGMSLNKGTLCVVTLPGIIPSYKRGATVTFDVPGVVGLKTGMARLRIPLDCRVLPRDGKPAFPARVETIKFTCNRSASPRSVLFRDVRIEKKGFFAELSVGNGDFLVGDLDNPERNDPHFTLVNASQSPCNGSFEFVVRHQTNGEVTRRTISRTFAANERFRVDLPRPDKCVVYYVDTTIGRVAGDNAFSYTRTYSYGAMHPVRHPRPSKDGEFRFSMCTHFNHYPWEEQMCMADYMAYAGLNCVRGGPTTYWCFKAPRPDVWYDNQVCDRLTDELIARGIEPMGELGYPAQWALDKELNLRNYPRLDEYEKFCECYVREKKGKVRFFECINEPDLIPGWTAELYGNYEAAAYRGLKRGNPDALLKSGEWAGFGGGMADIHYARQKDTFDVMAFHYHGFFHNDVGTVQHIKSTIRQTGVTQPWFADECARGTCDDHLSAITYFCKLVFSWAKGAMGYTWYNLRMKGWGSKAGEPTYGILTPDLGPREAYLTCNMICGTFQGAQFVNEVMLKPDVMAFRFERTDTDVALVPFWSMGRNFGTQTVFARTDAKSAELIDIVGNVTRLKIRDGIVALPVGLDPYTLRLAGARSTLERVSPLTESDRVLVFVGGSKTKAKFSVHNPYAAPVNWKVSVAAPDFVEAAPDAFDLSIPAGGSAPLNVAFAVSPAFRADADSSIVRVVVTGDGFDEATEFKTFPAARCTPKKPASFKATSRDLYVSYVEGLPSADHLYWDGAGDLCAYLLAFYPEGSMLHLRVVVGDDKHVPVMSPKRTWEGDGLQLLLSLPAQAGTWEINMAVSEDLKKSVCDINTAPVGFDGEALGGKVRVCVRRDEEKPSKPLWYDIYLPFKDFGMSPATLLREGLRLNVMVNDRDYDRREGYISMLPSDRSNPPKDADKFPLVVFGPDSEEEER